MSIPTEWELSLSDSGFSPITVIRTFASQQWELLRGKHQSVSDIGYHSFIDPEALFLISLGVQHIDRKFDKELKWFTSHCSHLINFQRLRKLARFFPPTVYARLGPYTHIEWPEKNGDYQRRSTFPIEGSRTKTIGLEPDFSLNQALILRLRSCFGTSVETDILSCLIGNSKELTADRIAELTDINPERIWRKLDAMVLSRFIKRSLSEAGTTFRANQTIVTSLLKQSGNENDMPVWLSWVHIYSFLYHVFHFTDKANNEKEISQKMINDADRILQINLLLFAIHGLEAPEPPINIDYMAFFQKSVRSITSWLYSDPITVSV